MKKLLLFFLILFVYSTAFATDYYVKNGGNDGAAGTSDALAWATIAKINDFAEATGFASGDTINLKCGSTWTSDEGLGYDDAAIQWGTINGLTIQSYGTGNKPILDGNTQRAIFIDGDNGTVDHQVLLSNLVIQNIDIKGEDFDADTSMQCIFICYVNGVHIDNVDGNGHTDATNYYSKDALVLSPISGTIEIENCNFQDYGPEVIPTNPGNPDACGIVVGNMTSGSISIHDNIVYGVNGDCIQIVACTVADHEIYNNTLYNAGENSIDSKGCAYVDIHDNTMYRAAAFVGGLSTTGILNIQDDSGTLNAINDWGIKIHGNIFNGTDANYINITGNGTTEQTGVKIYENNFNLGDQAANVIGISIDESDGAAAIEIYQNIFTGIKKNIAIASPVANLYIQYNIFKDMVQNTDATYGDVGGIYQNNAGANVRIENNTFYTSGSGTCETAYNTRALANPNTHTFKNNLIYLDHATPTEALIYINNSSLAVIDHNLYYNPSDTLGSEKVIKKGTTTYTAATFTSTWLPAHAGEINIDPLVVSSSDLSLQSVSPCRDTGIFTGGTVLTDYAGNPTPRGPAFDIGAYEYQSGGTIYGTMTGTMQ